jgi:hypothetical protein
MGRETFPEAWDWLRVMVGCGLARWMFVEVGVSFREGRGWSALPGSCPAMDRLKAVTQRREEGQEKLKPWRFSRLCGLKSLEDAQAREEIS